MPCLFSCEGLHCDDGLVMLSARKQDVVMAGEPRFDAAERHVPASDERPLVVI
jgi:hypothetical protein